MKPFSDENFELKVYLKYIVDTAKDNRKQKCIMDYIEEKNTEKLEKFVDKYEFTYVNLTRLATKDMELIPLMKEFITIYEKAEAVVDRKEENNEDNINRMSYDELDKYVTKKMTLTREEGNDKDE